MINFCNLNTVTVTLEHTRHFEQLHYITIDLLKQFKFFTHLSSKLETKCKTGGEGRGFAKFHFVSRKVEKNSWKMKIDAQDFATHKILHATGPGYLQNHCYS